jgi:hypothetical protein
LPLKFAHGFQRLHWLFEVKLRFCLRVLNHIVISSHIDLLVRDQGTGKIARSGN